MTTSDLLRKPLDIAPARTATISETAYLLLRDDINSGRLPPGGKLRVQTLRERYELGVSPIREALIRLSGEGLVQDEGQRGFRVSKLSKKDLLDLMQARTAIELLLLEDAIKHGDDDWGANITAAYYKLTKAQLPKQPSDIAAATLWETAHRNFHQALLAAASSQWLLRLDEQLVNHSERYSRIRLIHPSASTRLADSVPNEHRELMEATLARNTEQAAQLLQQHLIHTTEALSEFLTD